MKIEYRPEVDGLRTIAVSTVIIYHAHLVIDGKRLFPAGFLGVDVFFVISGYLITSLILKEIFLTNTFSFTNFYERRMRRIIPPYLFVLLLSLPVAWSYLPAEYLLKFSNAAISSIFFISNFYFFYSGNIYGDIANNINPLIHMWSLSVEEQYYIFFPILTIFLFKIQKNRILFFLVIIFLISFFLSNFLSKHHPSSTFYLIHTRSWELFAGSILAYVNLKKINIYQGALIKILPTLGLLLILISMIFLNDDMRNPSYLNLGAIFGAILIIHYSNKNNKEFVYYILTNKIFVFVGLLSYSLYLIHQPIFAFARITSFSGGSLIKQLLIIISVFSISLFSYYFIERPSRNRKNSFKSILGIVIFFGAILFLLNSLISYKKGFPSRGGEILQQQFVKAPWNLLENENNERCHDNKNPCIFNQSSKKEVFLVGDSVAATLGFNLKERLEAKNYRFNTYLRGGCLFFPSFNRIEKQTGKIDEICNSKKSKEIENKILSKKDSTIIIFGMYSLYITGEHFSNSEKWDHVLLEDEEKKYNSFKNSFKEKMIRLAKNGNKVVLVYPYPEIKVNPRNKLFNIMPKNVQKSEKFLKDKNNIIKVSFEDFKKRNQEAFQMLDSIKNENIIRVYPHSIVCNTLIKSNCIAHDDKHLFYYDEEHPSYVSSILINEMIIKKLFDN